MQRTAEEFVHELPNGRWFVGDFREDGARWPVDLPRRAPRGITDGTEIVRRPYPEPRGDSGERASVQYGLDPVLYAHREVAIRRARRWKRS